MSLSVTRAFTALGLVLLCLAPAQGHHTSSATGTLTVVRATNKVTGVSTTLYRVGDTPVTFKAAPPVIAPGSYVEVHGEQGAAGEIVAANGGSMRVITTAPAPSTPTGPQTTVVLIVNLRDKAATLTPTAAKQMMFGTSNSVDALYREASFGKVSFTGDVFGPITIANSASETDEWKWAYAADDVAKAQGVNFANYKRRVYVFPDTSAIEYGGLGTIGGSPSRAWVYDDDATTFAHELGHNLGLQHAATPDYEYGDGSCPMGNPSGLVHHNAPHKAELGWIPAAQIQTVAATGTFQVANTEEDRSLVQILKIAKPDTGEAYWVSYRSAIGYDATNLSWRYRARTSIHRFTKGEKSYLLANLADGESWSDSANKITIKQTSHDAQKATVSVWFGPVPFAPTVTVGSTYGSAGAPRTVSVTVTNNDSSSSAASTFTLSTTPPAGWTASVSPTTLTLAAGASGTATLTVTPSATATAGSYTVRVSTSDPAKPVHAASGTTTYRVLASTAVAKGAKVTASSLNVRETPMGTILGAVPAGHVFVRTGRTDQGFSEVYWAGKKAWVGSSYLAGTSANGFKLTTGAYVRTGASASNASVGTAPVGHMYADAPTGNTTNYRAVQWDGTTIRYIYRSYTTDIALEP